MAAKRSRRTAGMPPPLKKKSNRLIEYRFYRTNQVYLLDPNVTYDWFKANIKIGGDGFGWRGNLKNLKFFIFYLFDYLLIYSECGNKKIFIVEDGAQDFTDALSVWSSGVIKMPISFCFLPSEDVLNKLKKPTKVKKNSMRSRIGKMLQEKPLSEVIWTEVGIEYKFEGEEEGRTLTIRKDLSYSQFVKFILDGHQQFKWRSRFSTLVFFLLIKIA